MLLDVDNDGNTKADHPSNPQGLCGFVHNAPTQPKTPCNGPISSPGAHLSPGRYVTEVAVLLVRLWHLTLDFKNDWLFL